MRKCLLTLLVCSTLSVAACNKAPVQHPGAVNAIDSNSYDSVLALKTIIDSTKADLAAGKFSDTLAPKVKALLNNTVIPAYNALDSAYLAYHAAVAADSNASSAALMTAIGNANDAQQLLVQAKVGGQ